MYGSKKGFSLSACTLFPGLIFFLFLFPDRGAVRLHTSRGRFLFEVAPPVWNISVLFIIILGTPSVSVMNDSFKLQSISSVSSIPSTFSCALLDYHGHCHLLFSIKDSLPKSHLGLARVQKFEDASMILVPIMVLKIQKRNI